MPTIAIVNNEKNVALSLEMNLRQAGYQVRVYSRTDEALAALLAEPADLALIDKTNPPLGGVELLRRLRHHTAMPIIFLSAWAEELLDEFSCTELEADDYIELPFSLAHVRSRVETILARQAARATSRTKGN